MAGGRGREGCRRERGLVAKGWKVYLSCVIVAGGERRHQPCKTLRQGDAQLVRELWVAHRWLAYAEQGLWREHTAGGHTAVSEQARAGGRRVRAAPPA